MANRRVVITGIGVVNGLGTGHRDYFENLKAGKSAVARIRSFDPAGFPCQIGAEAPELNINKIVPKAQRKSTKLMNRDIQLVVAAAHDAMTGAGLNTRANNPDGPIDIDPVRSGVNLGAGTICCDLPELALAASQAVDARGRFSLKLWGQAGMTNLTPLWMLRYLPNMLNSHISIIYDLQGPSNSITTAEVSGMLSAGEAWFHIAHDRADLMVAGGGESKIIPMGLIRECLMQRASTGYNDRPEQGCRPFDSRADGSVLGEGAGILILEALDSALKRNARIYAEVVGFGASQNFHRSVNENEPDCQGTVCAIRHALSVAGIEPAAIDLIVPHGIGVPDCDRAEARALRDALGPQAGRAALLTTNWAIGACGAASGAIDVVTAAMALEEGVVPGNVNTPDPQPDLGLSIATQTQSRTLRHALITACNHGGQTAAMVLKKYQG